MTEAHQMNRKTDLSTALGTGMTLGRRRLLFGAGAIGGAALLTACTGNEPEDNDASAANVNAGSGDNAAPGKEVTIGFSAPAADHGWIAAITTNAKAQAEQYEDVTLNAVEGSNDVNQQISQVETLISQKPDALVILPFDGQALTEVAIRAMDAGIPVINLDRVFSSPRGARAWIGGDNYGMGAAAGRYIAEQMEAKGVTNPIIGEVQGIANLPLTQDRTKGFVEALAAAGMKVSNRVSAEFTVESGQQVTANLLQAAPKLDALWNHDDDQGIGVLAAIDQAGRTEFIMVGGAGSKNAMELIKADSGVLKATVTYPPSMASDAINLARLVAQEKGMSDLVENEIPASITLASATVTKENVDKYLPLGFAS
jgi:ribose transport system substrate-binding protein